MGRKSKRRKSKGYQKNGQPPRSAEVNFPIGICRQTQSGGFRCRPSASASDWLAEKSVRIQGQSIPTYLPGILANISLANCHRRQPRHLLDSFLRCVRCLLTLLNQLIRNECLTHQAEKIIIPNSQNVCLSRNCADAILIYSLFLMPPSRRQKNRPSSPPPGHTLRRLSPRTTLPGFFSWHGEFQDFQRCQISRLRSPLAPVAIRIPGIARSSRLFLRSFCPLR